MTPTVDTNFIIGQSIGKLDAENAWSKLYEDAIEILARAEESHTFESASCEQTAVIIKNIVRFSKQKVCIYVNELSLEVSDRIPGLLDILGDFLENRESKLWIAVEKPFSEKEANDEIGIYRLAQSYSEKFKVKIASIPFKESLTKIKYELKIDRELYFAVGDKKSFQIMTNAESYKGYGSFNNRNVAEKLNNSFTNHFLTCDDYFTKIDTFEKVYESVAQ